MYLLREEKPFRGPKMPKLDAFDHAGWLKGLTLDFTAWGGVKIKLSKIKKPSSVLASKFDLDEYQTRLDRYGARYDQGIELFEDTSIVDSEESKNIKKNREEEPLRKTRYGAKTNLESLCRAIASKPKR